VHRNLVTSHTYDNYLARSGQEGRVEDLTGYGRQFSTAEPEVRAGDQRMRLAASKGGLEAVDGGQAVITR
jgi:hypothetical protein